jgi:6-phosphogluconate dehydrogenase
MSKVPTADCDIGVIGLAVMGENLASNIADRGYKVAVFNRTTSKVDEFVSRSGTSPNIAGTHTLKEFCARLKRPRRVMMMVKAGEVVDQTIAQLEPYLEKGDILIDGGNSLFTDTERRCTDLEKKGLLFVGTGVSGGEEGARHGPSIMPGGHEAAWPHVKEILQAIAAKAIDGTPCCRWVGSGGAGHYVKMVHNGIEYGDMQLIGEAYQLLKDGIGLDAVQLAKTFAAWNKTELDSFLIEITAAIFAKIDEGGGALIDKILDAAGQKGTGKWTAISALDLGMPVTLIGESVFARCLSAIKEQRVSASRILKGPPAASVSASQEEFIESVRSALYCSKIISYAQGYMLLKAAEKERGWNLHFGEIAMLWSGGCIIRSVFLGDIKNAFERDPALANLLLDDFFRTAIDKYQHHWRNALIQAIKLGIPTPAFSTALAFYDGYRSARLPANLLQAQRDFFGAHTYERVDQPRGKFFHTNWTGRGGTVTSSTYDA